MCSKVPRLEQSAGQLFLRVIRFARLVLALAWAVGVQDLVHVRVVLAQAPSKAERQFELRIENGKVRRAEGVIRVRKGDQVRLRWTADDSVMIHLHGYDIEARVAPDTPVDMAFDAYATGRFPIALHPSHEGARADQKFSGHAGSENVLLYLEVHPR
jgi:hypothetical protein